MSASRGALTSTFKFSSGNEVVSAGIGTLGATDIFLDAATTDNDTLNATLAANSGTFMAQNIETINITAANAAAALDLTNVTGVKAINMAGTTASAVGVFAADLVQPAFGVTGYTNTLTIAPNTLAGTTALGTAEAINLTVSGASFGTTATTQSAVVISGAGGAGTLETLNITSSGTAANVFSLATAGGSAFATINLLGAADATVRMVHADVTGVTVVGSANTATTTLLIDRNGAAATGTSLATVSGVDIIAFRDSTAGVDALVATSAVSGSVIEARDSFPGANSISVTGSAASTTDRLTLNLDHTTAATSVTLASTNIQDVETLTIGSNGNSAALIAAGNALTLVADATTVTITGDTALTLTVNIDSPSTGSRTSVISAAGMTGTAAVSITAAADTQTTNLYTMTGTANADTLVGGIGGVNNLSGGDGADSITGGAANDTISGGTGADTITTTAGTDTITLGDGNDIVILAASVANTTAVAQVNTLLNLNTTVTLAANDFITVTIGGATYSTVFGDDAADTITDFVAAHAGTILALNGVTVVAADTNTDLQFTGVAAGTAFTVTSRIWDNSAGAFVTQDVTATTAGNTVGTGDNIISDFSSTDIISLANLTLAADGYFEGAVGDATAANNYTVMVLTAVSFASANAAQTAINAQLTPDGNADGIVVYLDNVTGFARAYYTDTIDGNSGENNIIDFTNITTLALIGSTFSAASFGL